MNAGKPIPIELIPLAVAPQPVALTDLACHDDVCITCSDQAVRVTVLHLLDDELAVVRTETGSEEEVSVALVSATVGDVVLVHASEAIAVLGGEQS